VSEYQKACLCLQKCDVIIFGSADASLLRPFLFRKDKIIFQYSERLFKSNHFLFLRELKNRITLFNRGDAYLLCSSAYAKNDYNHSGRYKGRCCYFGYFPEGNLQKELSSKNIDQSSPKTFLWSGRLLDWKHPEYCFFAFDFLSKRNVDFEINIVGDGPLLSVFKSKISQSASYSKKIHLFGALSNKQNLEEMAKADFFIFSSDQHEGWGAVLNEAMSSRCCVIASALAGATPFLIKNGINGLSFRTKREFLDCLNRLVSDFSYSQKLALGGFNTIKNEWNGQIAGHNFFEFCCCVKDHREFPDSLINNGPGTLMV
jgi:glycosyltransferase involved in cell wall biosynthesis